MEPNIRENAYLAQGTYTHTSDKAFPVLTFARSQFAPARGETFWSLEPWEWPRTPEKMKQCYVQDQHDDSTGHGQDQLEQASRTRAVQDVQQQQHYAVCLEAETEDSARLAHPQSGASRSHAAGNRW